RGAIADLALREAEHFRRANPMSMLAIQGAHAHWYRGVPFHWMLDWPGPAPLVAAHASGATLTTLDGRVLDDFCLGDTASMFGHSPPALATALEKQVHDGLSYMLPTTLGNEVGDMLAQMFGLPVWQVATTASEANRAVIRWCRGTTGRRKVLVFNGCYHGSVDDVFVDLRGGVAAHRTSLIGQVHDLLSTTCVIEFNDEDSLATALHAGDVACVLAEPVMTNVGMVRDAAGYLARLRELCSETGTILVFDETHTLSSGYGGHAQTHGLAPDMIVIGKSIGGGVPVAVYGASKAMAAQMARLDATRSVGHSGIGTTLSANALSMAAMHAMLGAVITPSAYAHMLALAGRLVAGLESIIARHHLDWHIAHDGARVEFVCSPQAPTNGSEARAAMRHDLESAIHLYLANRGILLAPFHNMMLLSPVTSEQQVDHLTSELNICIAELTP
ncbi:MAG: aspartate aminotransferase family protein, partial [Sphingopyxis sp.]